MLMLLKIPEAFDFLPKAWVMKRQVIGYDDMFRSASALVADPADLILAADYKLASLAWYYLPGNPEIRVLTQSRRSQYDFWLGSRDQYTGRNALFFGTENQAAGLAVLFEKVTELPYLVYSDRYISREIRVYRCHNLKLTDNL